MTLTLESLTMPAATDGPTHIIKEKSRTSQCRIIQKNNVCFSGQHVQLNISQYEQKKWFIESSPYRRKRSTKNSQRRFRRAKFLWKRVRLGVLYLFCQRQVHFRFCLNCLITLYAMKYRAFPEWACKKCQFVVFCLKMCTSVSLVSFYRVCIQAQVTVNRVSWCDEAWNSEVKFWIVFVVWRAVRQIELVEVACRIVFDGNEIFLSGLSCCGDYRQQDKKYTKQISSLSQIKYNKNQSNCK